MRALSRSELSMLLTWAFNEQEVETAANPHVDALTLYFNVMALPVPEAVAIVTHARAGAAPEDPVQLALWTRGLSLLCDMLQQPMCELEMFTRGTKTEASSTASAA
ncbi:hypothetical protein [Pelagibacterium halotolerans]|uniref:hypothetical protein n=1 Tax=Pelagibacterium halotolerans TaxID=531813 RepID=UPI00385044A1